MHTDLERFNRAYDQIGLSGIDMVEFTPNPEESPDRTKFMLQAADTPTLGHDLERARGTGRMITLALTGLSADGTGRNVLGEDWVELYAAKEGVEGVVDASFVGSRTTLSAQPHTRAPGDYSYKVHPTPPQGGAFATETALVAVETVLETLGIKRPVD